MPWLEELDAKYAPAGVRTEAKGGGPRRSKEAPLLAVWGGTATADGQVAVAGDLMLPGQCPGYARHASQPGQRRASQPCHAIHSHGAGLMSGSYRQAGNTTHCFSGICRHV